MGDEGSGDGRQVMIIRPCEGQQSDCYDVVMYPGGELQARRVTYPQAVLLVYGREEAERSVETTEES